jgi:CBS domain containing-hemolysin-like protein
LALLLLFVGFALGVSFLCSLLEATLLSAPLAMLIEQQSAGNRGAGLLLDLKRHRVDEAISAILILNTVSNTLGATLAGARAADLWGSASIGIFAGVMTLLILIISEIIPKTLGVVYSRSATWFVGRVLHFLTRAMAPALVVSRALTHWLTRDRASAISREELTALIEAAASEGALSPVESTVLDNLMRIDEVKVEDVMTPRTVTFTMPVEASVADLLSKQEAKSYSRIPLYRDDPDNVVGYVLQLDVMRAAAADCDRMRRLESFRREISYVPEMIGVGQALRQFLERRETLAVVTDEHGGLAGLVTLEDLTETLLGTEIVDESDRTVDLRQTAAELRNQRLERLRHKREKTSDER